MSSSEPELSEAAARTIRNEAGSYFKPASPITAAELFSGRREQLERTFDAIFQSGQHVVLYGERGVGKTSMANVLAQIQAGRLLTVKVNCDVTDSFATAWRKILEEITFSLKKRSAGFTEQTETEVKTLAEQIPDEPSPSDVLRTLRELPENMVFIFDEFDRLKRKHAAVFADLIKALSDYDVAMTLVLVGVSDTVNELITDHASIDRSLVQIHMPRMRTDELRGILTTGTKRLGMTISSHACDRIIRLSQGLPHYTHLLGLAVVRSAAEDYRLSITPSDVESGLLKAVDGAQQSIKSLYHQATTSARSDALFEHVLLACALSHKDSLSFFQAADVAGPMTDIMSRKFEIPAFARHLREFCEPKRGPVLARVGRERNYRFRFKNPLIEPYVIMRGLTGELITADQVSNGDTVSV